MELKHATMPVFEGKGHETFTVCEALYFLILGLYRSFTAELVTKPSGVGAIPLTHPRPPATVSFCTWTTPLARLLQLPNLRRFFLQGYQGDKKNPGVSYSTY